MMGWNPDYKYKLRMDKKIQNGYLKPHFCTFEDIKSVTNTINELLKNTSFATINDCDKAISEVEKCEKEIEKSKKTVVKFCNEYTKQLNEVSFDIDAVAYAKNFIEKVKLGFTDYTNQFVNQLKSNENQILQAKIKIISG